MTLPAVDAIAISSPVPKRSCAAHLYGRLTISIRGSISLNKININSARRHHRPHGNMHLLHAGVQLGPVGMGRVWARLGAVQCERSVHMASLRLLPTPLSSEVKVPERRSFPPGPYAHLVRRAAIGYSPVGDQDPCEASIRVAESADTCSHRRPGLLSGCDWTTSCRSENRLSHTWPHSDASPQRYP